MGKKFPALTDKDVIRVLRKIGFEKKYHYGYGIIHRPVPRIPLSEIYSVKKEFFGKFFRYG